MASFRKRGCVCPKNRKCTCGATWEFRISVTNLATGERSQPGESGFNTKEEAKQAAAELKRKYNSGLLSASAKDETVESFMEKFLQNILINEVEKNTLEQKISQMERYIVPKLGRIHLKALTPIQVQKFINDLGSGDLVAGTIINIVRLLNQTLNKAVEWGYVERNVASMVSKPKYKPEKFQVWTKQHFEFFLQNTRNSRLYPFYLLGLTTGMRPGEITALTWNHINFRSKTIRIEQTVAWTKEKGIHIKQSPKNDASRRTITVPEQVISYLKEYKIAQTPNSQNIVIPGVKNDLMYNSVINQIMKDDIARTGVPVISPHDLRHTHATYLLSPAPFGLAQGIKAVSERLGHAKTSTTLNTYTHVLPNMQESLAEVLNTAINL